MRLGGKFLFAEGKDDVLDEYRPPRMQIGIVRADERSQHRGAEKPEQPQRQHGTQRHRNACLAFKLLGLILQ